MKSYIKKDLRILEYHVQKSQNGCSESTEYVINFFMPFIRKMSKSTFIEYMDTKDIEQSLIMYLLVAIKKYINTNTFFWYAIKTMKNNIYLELKKSKKNISCINIENTTIMDNFYTEDYIIDHENYYELRRGLSKLNDKDSKLLYKFYFEDYSYDDMINYFGKSYTAIGAQKNRALNKLKSIIFKYNN